MTSLNARQWNAKYPVGTPVRYHPTGGDSRPIDTHTTSDAWVSNALGACIMIEGVSGAAVSLERLEPRRHSPRERFDQIGSQLLQCGADMHGIAMILESGAIKFIAQTQELGDDPRGLSDAACRAATKQLERVIELATAARNNLNVILPILEAVRDGDDLKR